LQLANACSYKIGLGETEESLHLRIALHSIGDAQDLCVLQLLRVPFERQSLPETRKPYVVGYLKAKVDVSETVRGNCITSMVSFNHDSDNLCGVGLPPRDVKLLAAIDDKGRMVWWENSEGLLAANVRRAVASQRSK
jgi:hypothetical protein